MKTADGVEVGSGEGVGGSCLQLLNQCFHVGGDKLLFLAGLFEVPQFGRGGSFQLLHSNSPVVQAGAILKFHEHAILRCPRGRLQLLSACPSGDSTSSWPSCCLPRCSHPWDMGSDREHSRRGSTIQILSRHLVCSRESIPKHARSTIGNPFRSRAKASISWDLWRLSTCSA